ncbi:hypothetical protein BDZ89DRAFT_106922 [Hymenopellis radicata]|nr:hypothetical protein BDZ89DRAFT_106922 [Hymenopellis radicata]
MLSPCIAKYIPSPFCYALVLLSYTSFLFLLWTICTLYRVFRYQLHMSVQIDCGAPTLMGGASCGSSSSCVAFATRMANTRYFLVVALTEQIYPFAAVNVSICATGKRRTGRTLFARV